MTTINTTSDLGDLRVIVGIECGHTQRVDLDKDETGWHLAGSPKASWNFRQPMPDAEDDENEDDGAMTLQEANSTMKRLTRLARKAGTLEGLQEAIDEGFANASRMARVRRFRVLGKLSKADSAKRYRQLQREYKAARA